MEEIRNEEATGFPVEEHLVGLRDARWKWVRTTDARSGRSSDQVWDLGRDPLEASPRSLSDSPDLPASFLEAMRAVRGGPR
jgi:hypothetical protein